MAWRRASIGVGIAVVAVIALGIAISAFSQRPLVLVRSAIAGDVVAQGLARVNQDVKEGDPLVYVQSTTENRPVLAAVAPVDGRVVRVAVRPGSRVNIGDVVAAIQP